MSGIYLSGDEMDALTGAPSLAQRLYILAIRPSMSFGTGLVGAETKISWHGLARELRVEAARGIKEELPSKEQVRRAAQHLVKRGLIIEKSEGMRLVFRCLLARLSSSAQIKADTNPTGSETQNPTGSDDNQVDDYKDLFDVGTNKADTIGDTRKTENPTYIRESEIKPTTTSSHASGDSFSMHIGWRPSENFADRLRLTGIDHESIPTEQRKLMVGEFVSFWLGQPARKHRQSEWDHKLIQHIAKNLRSAIPGGRQHEARQSNPAPRSAVERVAAANGIDISTGEELNGWDTERELKVVN